MVYGVILHKLLSKVFKIFMRLRTICHTAAVEENVVVHVVGCSMMCTLGGDVCGLGGICCCVLYMRCFGTQWGFHRVAGVVGQIVNPSLF